MADFANAFALLIRTVLLLYAFGRLLEISSFGIPHRIYGIALYKSRTKKPKETRFSNISLSDIRDR